MTEPGIHDHDDVNEMVLAVAITAISPYCESFVSFCDLSAFVETDQLPPGHFVFMTAMV